MAHNLNFRNGEASFFTAREIAWHGLGKVVDKSLTSAEAIIAAQLDYEVGLEKNYVPVQEITKEEAFTYNRVLKIGDKYYKVNPQPNHYGTFRRDTGDVFNVVGDKYHVLQNIEAFEFFDTIVGQGAAQYETAGALGLGETIFITAKLPETILVGGHDKIDLYLLLTTSHDGKNSIQVLLTPIRVVCNNTLTMALQGAKYKCNVKHTVNAKVRLQLVETVLGITKEGNSELRSIFTKMAETNVVADDVNKYFIRSLGLIYDERGRLTTRSVNILNQVINYYHNGPGQEMCFGTVYGMYNAVTGYFQNVKDYKTSENKMTGIIEGSDARKSDLAFNLAKELIHI